MAECKISENIQSCSCTYPNCPRKGKCCECVTHHREKGEIPGCFFSADNESTYNRSIANFIQTNS